MLGQDVVDPTEVRSWWWWLERCRGDREGSSVFGGACVWHSVSRKPQTTTSTGVPGATQNSKSSSGLLTSCSTSCAAIALRTFFLEVSWISPPTSSSSRMKYAFSKLKIMSNSQTWKGGQGVRTIGTRVSQTLTLPKYLSRSSTYLWMISNVSNSLSFCSMAQQKYKLAYLEGKGESG